MLDCPDPSNQSFEAYMSYHPLYSVLQRKKYPQYAAVMPIVFFAANGRHIKNETDWASTLAIFKQLETKLQGSAYQVCLPDNRMLQDFLDFLGTGEFAGFNIEGYRVEFIHNWEKYVRGLLDEDAETIIEEAEELKRRLNAEG